MQLIELKPGQRARIVGFHPMPHQQRQLLLAMGLTQGTEVELVRFAPFGDPIELCVRGFHLCLRKAQAKTIEWQGMEG